MLGSRRAFLWVLGASLVGACSLRDLSDLEGEAAEQATGGAGGVMDAPSGGSDALGGGGGQGGETPLGGAPATGGESGTGGEVEPPPDPRAYSHSITCNGGGNDWIIDEHRFVSSNGTAFYYRVSWDADFVYLSIEGGDFTGTQNKTVTFYIGNGTSDGQSSGRNLATDVDLPYFAQLLVEFDQSSSDATAYESNSVTWTSTGSLGATEFDGNSSTGFVELCLDRATYGLEGDDLLLSANVSNQDNSDAVFAALPAGALSGTVVTGTASFTEYFHFMPNAESDPPLAPTGFSPVVP